MPKLIIKSLVLGFIVGAVFLGLFPLGLVIAFVEFLRPILIPGIDLIHKLGLNLNVGGSWFMMLGLILNGLIYSILFLSILAIRKYVVSRKIKFMAILFVILAFLAVTGMLANLYYFITSPNKSWIFMVGP